ncbi:unnamed protein product [Ectocarpus sp. 4 AP-2014]
MSLPGDEIWRFQAGASYDDDAVYGVSADAEGSFFLAGKTTGSLDGITLNEGGEDMAVGKLDSDGVLLWSWQEGTTGEDTMSDAAATDDGGVVVGGYFNGTLSGVASEGLGDFIAIKFDSDGIEEWRWQVRKAIRRVASVGGDRIYFSPALSLGLAARLCKGEGPPLLVVASPRGSQAPAIARAGGDLFSCSNSKNASWRLAATNHDVASGGRGQCPYCCDDTPIAGGRGFCTTSTSPDFLVFGTCRGAQDGTEKDEVISTCSKTADGNVVLTGLTQGDWVEINTGLWALVAVKLDVADGSVIWRYQAGVPSYSVVSRGAASRADGSIVIGGTTDGDWDGELTGYADFFSVALDEDGSELWRFQDGSLFSMSSAWGVAALSDGSVVLAGTTDGDYAETNAGAQDFAVVKLTEEGVLDWTWQDGTPYDESFEGVATGIDGTSMVFAGYTFGTWAAEQAEDEDDMDAVGMSMDGDGTLLWTYQAGTTYYDNFIGVDVGPDGAALLAGFSQGAWEDPTADFYADFAGVLIETGAVPATPAPADDIVITPSTPSPVTDTLGGTSAGSCGDGESFLITSDALPAVEGCFQSTQLSFSDGDEYEEYSVSGTSDWDQVTVFGVSSALADDDGNEIRPFYLAFFTQDEYDIILYCHSNEDAITVHPADATWLCDLDGTGTYEDVTDEEVSMDCGCTSTAPAPVVTDSPVAAPALTPVISEGESTSSSSSSVPLGPLIGGIVGGVAFLALVGIFVVRRRARSDQSFGNAPVRSKSYPAVAGGGGGAVAGGAGAAKGDVPPPPPPAYTEPPPPMADARDIDLPPPPAYSEPPVYSG